MTGFDVLPAELRFTATYLSDLHSELGDGLRSLCAEVESLLDGRWHGAAAAGFAVGWTDWYDGARAVLATLQGFAALLASTADAYQLTEDGAAHAHARLAAELSG